MEASVSPSYGHAQLRGAAVGVGEKERTWRGWNEQAWTRAEASELSIANNVTAAPLPEVDPVGEPRQTLSRGTARFDTSNFR
jgi:hypothetical protein